MRRSLARQTLARTVQGFTLIELMVGIAIVGIMLSIAMPNMRTFVQNSRLSAGVNDLLASMQNARTQAIKRQQNVVVCASANPTAAVPVCSGGSFSTGWIVFVDGNANWQSDGGAAEPVLERHPALDATINVRFDGGGIESFGATGFANPAGAAVPTRAVVICDARGNTQFGINSTARGVLIAVTGRTRTAATFNDVTAALIALGQTCP